MSTLEERLKRQQERLKALEAQKLKREARAKAKRDLDSARAAYKKACGK